MWQAETFDPDTIDRELGWAASIGMNSMRVFLHDLLWREDADAFCARIDEYLAIADGHGISTLFVLFDSVWHPQPELGRQPDPQPGVHNTGWVQSPGSAILGDPSRHAELEPYLKGVIGWYRDDHRVLGWDLFNEPDNANGGKRFAAQLPAPEKHTRSCELLLTAFRWAREIDPTQPLTAAVWGNRDWAQSGKRIDIISLENSDVITFHTHEGTRRAKRWALSLLRRIDRPLTCTEYMARTTGSTFEGVLPVFQQHRIGAYNWGLVSGRSQTIYPWDSSEMPYSAPPKKWFHDVFERDGQPHRTRKLS